MAVARMAFGNTLRTSDRIQSSIGIPPTDSGRTLEGAVRVNRDTGHYGYQ